MTQSALLSAAYRLGHQQRRLFTRQTVRVSPQVIISEFQTRFLNSRSEERKAKRQAEVAARRARKQAAKEKEKAVKAYQESASKQTLNQEELQKEDLETEEIKAEKQRIRNERRQELLLEAGAMSRSLFRLCLRCVKIMRQGNEHDEKEFVERERNQFQTMKDAVASGTFSMAPPVDRENELSSRAIYYHGHTREHFEGDSDCLKPDPWREENVDTYLAILRQGEYKRKWVMNDYKFDDPYSNVFDDRRVDGWESKARDLLKETYEANGWILPSELHSTDWKKTKWDDDDDA